MKLEDTIRDATKALELAEGEHAGARRLADEARAAREAAAATYDREPTDEHGRRVLAARERAELTGIREERAARRVDAARAALEAAQGELQAERARLEAARRKAALEDAIRRASPSTVRDELADDIALYLLLVQQQRDIAKRIEARVASAQDAAREARDLGADVKPVEARFGEGLLLCRLIARLPKAEQTAERWAGEAVRLVPLFTAWINHLGRSPFEHRGALTHIYALPAAFPELWRHPGFGPGVSCAALLDTAARFEAGESIDDLPVVAPPRRNSVSAAAEEPAA